MKNKCKISIKKVVSQPGFGGQHGPGYLSRDGQEIKVGDYISYGFDPRKKGFPITQEFIDNLKKVTGFKEIGGVLYPTYEIDKTKN